MENKGSSFADAIELSIEDHTDDRTVLVGTFFWAAQGSDFRYGKNSLFVVRLLSICF